MPIKFSELTTKTIEDTQKIIGLYTDNTSETGVSNCLINTVDFAKQTSLTSVNESAVHKSGAETITGSKTFSSSIIFDGDNTFNGINTFNNQDLYIKSKTLNRTDSTQSGYLHLSFKDKNNKEMSHVKTSLDNGNITLSLAVTSDTSTNNYKGINIIYNSSSGNIVTQAQTPAANSNNTDIVTTKWIRTLLTTMYPVGSVYIGTQKTCPMEAIIPSSTWELVAANKALWTGSGNNGNTTIEAGLPNIKDNFYFVDTYYGSIALDPNSDAGLIKYNSKTTSTKTNRSDTDGTTTSRQKYVFDASQVNSIFGKSTTVQPPAYVVNVWRRTA